MKRSLFGLSLFVGLSLELVSISSMAQATGNNLVQNGSFETGYEATTQTNGGWPSNRGFWAPIGYFGATDTIPHWASSGGGVDWTDSSSNVPNSMVAADGARMVDLNSCCGNAAGVISQSIATTPGGSYTLSFNYSGHSYSGCYFGPKSLRARAGSVSTVVSADPGVEGYLDGTNLWHAASLSFTASGSSTVISFESLETNGSCAGPLVDNVRVTSNNLVQNGSFETGYENTTQVNGGWPSNRGLWAPIGYAGATDTIPHWTASGGGVDWQDSNLSVPNSMVAADGARMIDLNGSWYNAPGVISQTIATTPGAAYTLSFDYSGHSYSGCYFGPKFLVASAGSAGIVATTDPGAEGYLDRTNLWHAASFNFTASGSSTVISFESLLYDGTCGGPLVDNAWVLAQPPAPPQPVLDQSQTVSGWSAGGLDQWQSFTAGKTGRLTRLDLRVGSGLLNQSQAGVLRIYSGEGTGGPLLATQEVTFQDKLNEFQIFQFLMPALVQAGSLYTYRFSIPNINVGWVDLSIDNPYPNGRASHAPGADYLFRTYVTPPLP